MRKPDDFHVHLRSDAMLLDTLPDLIRRYRRVMVMPNLSEPVSYAESVLRYYNHIKEVMAGYPIHRSLAEFTPLMTLYLTPKTNRLTLEDAVKKCNDAGVKLIAVKWYPTGLTTNSNMGVTEEYLLRYSDLLEAMQDLDLVFCIHGESVIRDVFNRELLFATSVLPRLRKNAPDLRIVMEHITTETMVSAVMDLDSKVAATITPHHLYFDYNDMLGNGLNPHLYCKPILKAQHDVDSLRKAAVSGSPKFFLGSDSAPHPADAKECACGAAGIYNAHASLEMYATVFSWMKEPMGCINYGEDPAWVSLLEKFCSEHGANFYGLPLNKETITLRRNTPDNFSGQGEGRGGDFLGRKGISLTPFFPPNHPTGPKRMDIPVDWKLA